MEIKKLQSKADKLAKLRAKINKLESDYEAKVSNLKLERDALQAELLEDMAREKVASLRVENGDMYTRATRRSLTIVNEVLALKWALDNQAYSIDKRIVAQKLKDANELPDGFAPSETAYISIRKSKNDKKD